MKKEISREEFLAINKKKQAPKTSPKPDTSIIIAKAQTELAAAQIQAIQELTVIAMQAVNNPTQIEIQKELTEAVKQINKPKEYNIKVNRGSDRLMTNLTVKVK